MPTFDQTFVTANRLTVVEGTVRDETFVSSDGLLTVVSGAEADEFFTASGATQPIYGNSNGEAQLTQNGKTYVFWETYDRVADKRWTAVRAFTHSTGLWGRIYNVGPHSDAGAGDDDDHGTPHPSVNADGRVVVAWGDHDGTFHLATMTNVDDESLWTTLSNGFTTGPYTYPHATLIGTTMHWLFRKDVPPGAPYAAGSKILVSRPVTWSGATATVGTEVEIANFGNNARWYQGNAVLLAGDRIAQCAARADYNDTFRVDVHYYEVDHANSRLQAFGGTTVAFPVGLTDMNTTFRVVNTGTDIVQPPSLYIEGSRTHIIYSRGADAGTDQAIFHVIGESGTFAAPVDTGANVSSTSDGPRMIAGPSSAMQMHYLRQTTPDGERGGDWYYRSLAAAGAANAWGAETLVKAFDPTRWKFTQLGAVAGSTGEIRMVGWEGSQSATDANAFPGKRGHAWGDSGFKGNAQPTAADPAAWTGEGHWIEAHPDHCYSDVDMTTLSGVDGLVRAIVDRSGNGHHFILEGTEPGRLRLDDGIYWVDVGDEISPTCSYATTAYSAVADNAYWMTVAARDWQSAAQATDVAIMDDGTGGDRVCRLVRGANMQPQPIAYSTAGSSVNLGTGVTNTIRHNDDFILAAHVNGTAGTGYWNQAELGTATVGSAPDTGASVQRIGAAGALGATTYLRGRFYGLIQRAGNIALDQRTADMAYLRSKQPR